MKMRDINLLTKFDRLARSVRAIAVHESNIRNMQNQISGMNSIKANMPQFENMISLISGINNFEKSIKHEENLIARLELDMSNSFNIINL